MKALEIAARFKNHLAIRSPGFVTGKPVWDVGLNGHESRQIYICRSKN